jgi:NADP-dependent 3-hydroxy acid dehydrogenase YdfG
MPASTSSQDTTPVWFITGCSSGFGREIAKLVLERGWRAVLTARALESIAGLAASRREHALPLPLDVTSAAMIEEAVRKAEARFGRIDVLVNNAGYGYFSAIEAGEDEEIRRVFETNVFGLAALIRRVLPGMRQRRRGHIINFSSIGGLRAYPAIGYYSATKFAVEALSEALAQETAPLGIKVTIVEPGSFRTDFAGRSLAVSKTNIADYDETAGAVSRRIRDGAGRQPGDPARAAAAVIAAFEAEKPPLRLLLGRDAHEAASDHLDELRANFEAWKSVSTDTDHAP